MQKIWNACTIKIRTKVTIMTRVYPLLALITLFNTAYAQDHHYLPDAKLPPESVSIWNLGAGVTQQLIHLNTEWVNPYGIAYAKVGFFLTDDSPFGTQIGFRYPYYFTGKDKNGYYVGAYAGHIASKQVDNKDETRLGAGVDLAYVLLNKDRISTFSVGLGAGEELKNREGVVVEHIEPKIQFSYTLSMGLGRK